jgi:hypothetical protein
MLGRSGRLGRLGRMGRSSRSGGCVAWVGREGLVQLLARSRSHLIDVVRIIVTFVGSTHATVVYWRKPSNAA